MLLIFVSGKIVLTGAKVREEIYQAFEMIYPVLQGKLLLFPVSGLVHWLTSLQISARFDPVMHGDAGRPSTWPSRDGCRQALLAAAHDEHTLRRT
ncbi:hypothetical protein IMZ48_36120, partial [Candidatus Bathyarchaeota archaeon]|nr:hypothetical protein [Candidatus Bathyarchaeota archaeon]